MKFLEHRFFKTKTASERINPAGQRFSQTTQPNLRRNVNCAARLSSQWEVSNLKARPVGLLSKRHLLSFCGLPVSSRKQNHERKEGAMKKLHPNCPPKGAPIRYARSVIHWRTGKRIYPKTAKAFPLRGKKNGNDKDQLTLGV